MADINKSLEVLSSWEGGYSMNPQDPGGETYCGISRKKWPNWVGWVMIDKYKRDSGKIIPWNSLIPVDSLPGEVNLFYEQNFWKTQSFFALVNQDVADKVFQHYVNLGDRAIKFFQQAENNVGASLIVDGQLGPKTVAFTNSYPVIYPQPVLDKQVPSVLGNYIDNLVQYYEELITEHPQLHVFENEWMLRSKTIGKRP